MAHTFSNLLFHIIFGTKGRTPAIDTDLRAPLHAYIGGIVRELKGTSLCVNGTADHIHALVKLPPTLAVAEAMRVIKTNSSKWAHTVQRRPGLSWQSGYSAFTVSESALDAVRSYIEQQEVHHRVRTFQEEYLEFLNKHGVAYDPRYVFE